MRTFRLLLCLSVVFLALALTPALAQVEKDPIDYETARLERHLVARRCSSPVVIDGVLDEPDWGSAEAATHFIQNNPNEGEPATYDTEVRILYDEENLYIGATAYDDQPDKLVINDLTRDFNGSSQDVFALTLDTFHDRRSGFFFETNPRGAKYDAQFFNEGSNYELGFLNIQTREQEGVSNGDNFTCDSPKSEPPGLSLLGTLVHLHLSGAHVPPR